MSALEAKVSVLATERIVDALNTAVEIEGGAQARVAYLLRRLQDLLGRPSRYAIWMLEDLERKPSPLIRSRTVVDPDHDDGAPFDLAIAQQALDEAAPLATTLIQRALDNIRSPQTVLMSEAADSACFESVLRKRYLAPLRCVDCLLSLWSATENRAVLLICHQHIEDPPFSESERTLVSLMLRAAAPMLDREIFRREESELDEPLSQREREVLAMLLAGDSEKEIASSLHRSVHTVHTFVQRLYRRFNVSSRGELMAQFIDRTVIANLRDG